MNLTHDAMLVSLRINSWSGRLYDRQASQQVAIHHDADTNAGRYNKRLLPKQAFAALAATMSNARTSHNANTLPWDDQGGRLLTVANYERYTTALDTLVERVVRERARFIEDYDNYVDQARLDLGRLFRLEDYPDTEALQGKFAIRYRIVPVPEPRQLARRLEPGGIKFAEKRLRVHTIRRPVFEREDQSLGFGTAWVKSGGDFIGEGTDREEYGQCNDDDESSVHPGSWPPTPGRAHRHRTGLIPRAAPA